MRNTIWLSKLFIKLKHFGCHLIEIKSLNYNCKEKVSVIQSSNNSAQEKKRGKVDKIKLRIKVIVLEISCKHK